MTPDTAIDMVRETLLIALLIAGPVLGVGLLIGLAVSLFQAVTQIQEQTLSFAPKIVGMALMVILIAPWLSMKLLEFTTKMLAP